MKALAIASLILFAACGDDGGASGVDAEPDCMESGRGDTYAPGLEHIGAEGVTVRLMASVPAPPQRFDNTWTIQVEDSALTPRDDAAIEVTPWMPDHGHGTTADVVVTAEGSDGNYELDPVNLWMPGLWEIRMRIEVDATVDNVVFAFCIEE